MASNPQNEPRASREVEKPPIEPIRPPTVEEMRSQDIWSNCAIRSVVSGVMGYYQFSADSNSTLQNGTGTLFGTELEVTMWWKSYSDWI
ncbi:hypothetical protein ACFX13_036148 [Malus domestica]